VRTHILTFALGSGTPASIGAGLAVTGHVFSTKEQGGIRTADLASLGNEWWPRSSTHADATSRRRL